MESLTVVKPDIAGHTQFQLCERPVVFDIDVFVFQRPPESFHNDGIQRAVHTIHTDLYSMGFQDCEKRIRGELTPLTVLKMPGTP